MPKEDPTKCCLSGKPANFTCIGCDKRFNTEYIHSNINPHLASCVNCGDISNHIDNSDLKPEEYMGIEELSKLTKPKG